MQCITRHDRRARKRTFKVGDKVLILLPVQGQPLKARYGPPFTIEKKINDADYLVNTPSKHKVKHLCHVNLLKLHEEREPAETRAACQAMCSASVEVNDDYGIRKPKLTNSEFLQNLHRKLSHLKVNEQKDIKKLLFEY